MKSAQASKSWPFIQIGVMAGIIWGGLWEMAHFFRCTAVGAGEWLLPYSTLSWLPPSVAWLVSWIAFVIFSIASSWLFAYVAGTRYSFVKIGLLTSVSWLLTWPSWPQLEWVEQVTNICLLAQWALFIQYSAAWRNAHRNGTYSQAQAFMLK